LAERTNGLGRNISRGSDRCMGPVYYGDWEESQTLIVARKRYTFAALLEIF